MAYLQIIGGLVLLLGGGEILVRGAVSLAQKFGVSTLLIALTVVALGTSAPELVVCLNAALEDVPDIATGNVVGSNIANILLILGVAAIITPIACDPRAIQRDGSAVLIATLIFVGLSQFGMFVLWHGILLLALLIAYLGFSYITDRRGDAAADLHQKELESLQVKSQPLAILIAFVAGGLAALIIGAEFLVDGAVSLARAAGISEAVIGLTLVAFGTSLPELATCVVAAYRRAPEVALGNVLGSNMFNILGIMGAIGLVADIPVSAQIAAFDVWLMLGITILLLPLMLTGQRLGRAEASFLLLLYAAYITLQYYGVPGLFGILA